MKRIVSALFFLVLVLPATAATRYIATNGSDSNPGTSTAPFLTFNKCYQSSALGDVCMVRSGTYPGQTFSASSLSGSDSMTPVSSGVVTFQPVSGPGTVTVAGMTLGGNASTPVRHIAFQDMTLSDYTELWSVVDVHFTRVHMIATIEFFCSAYASFQDGEIGPKNDSVGDALRLNGGAYGINCNAAISPPMHHILIEGNTLHDNITSDSTAHPDTIEANAVPPSNNMFIRKNKFYGNCGINYRGGGAAVTIENNFFGAVVSCAVGTYYNVQIGSNATVRYNTIDGSVQEASPGYDGNMTWEGNIITGQFWGGCIHGTGSTALYNVWSTQNNAGCGSNNKQVSSFAGWFANLSTGDLHLTSATLAAAGAGNPADFPVIDIDGKIRPVSGKTPYAGASEFGTSTTGSLPEPPAGLTVSVN